MRKVDSTNMIVFAEDDEKYFENPIKTYSGFDMDFINFNNSKSSSSSSASSEISTPTSSHSSSNSSSKSNISTIPSPPQQIPPTTTNTLTNFSNTTTTTTTTTTNSTANEYNNFIDNFNKKGYWFQDEQNDFNHFDISFVGGHRVFMAGETIEIHLKVKVKRLQYLKATFECVSTSHNSKTKLFNKNYLISQDFYLYPTANNNSNNSNNNNINNNNTTNGSNGLSNLPLNKSNSSICTMGLRNSFTNINYQLHDEITLLEPLPEVIESTIKPPTIIPNGTCEHQECVKKNHHTFIIRIAIPRHCPTTFHMNKDAKNGVFYRIAISGLGELRNSKFNAEDSLIKGIQTYVPLTIVNPFGSNSNNSNEVNGNTNNMDDNIGSINKGGSNSNLVGLSNSISNNNLLSLLSDSSGSGGYQEYQNSPNNLSLLPVLSSTSLLPTHKLTLSNITMKSRLLFNQTFIIGSNVSLYISVLNKTNSTIKGMKIQLINKQQSWITNNSNNNINNNSTETTTQLLNNGNNNNNNNNEIDIDADTNSNSSNSSNNGSNQMKKSASNNTLSPNVDSNNVNNNVNSNNDNNNNSLIQCQHCHIISTMKFKTSDFHFHVNQKYQNTIVFSIPDNLIPTIILPNISNIYVLKISLRKNNFYKEIPIFLSSIC